MYPLLLPPDWVNLPGGDAGVSGALTARDRKLEKSAELVRTILPLARSLESANALYSASSNVLEAEPGAARWYLDLSGMSRKLITKVSERYAEYGLTVSPETVATNLSAGRAVSSENLESFSRWINSELEELYPANGRSTDLALATVLAMNGARIDGQVRNEAGEDAVLIVKTLLVGAMLRRGRQVEVNSSAGGWTIYSPAEHALADQRRLRFDGNLVCEFVAGGNRPDLKVLLHGVTILVGEIKGRTDLSNLWESWMPQINGHLQTWAAENGQAPRVFFGTIVTEEMIGGVTRGGTRHTGLRAFHRSGHLNAIYNLTRIAEGNRAAEAAFEQLVGELCRVSTAAR
ncbi:hypothetical protein BH23GEM6_BH23GEM6_24010 [soil metagenome]